MPVIIDFDLSHDPDPTCGCDLCLSFQDEMHTLADEHFAMFVDAMEGDPRFDQALPYELAFDGAA